jgi:hypothetical protein
MITFEMDTVFILTACINVLNRHDQKQWNAYKVKQKNKLRLSLKVMKQKYLQLIA